jgi:hypothetical protein
MVECMEDEAPTHPKGETKNKITQKNQGGLSNGSKAYNKCKWGQKSLGL